MSRFGDLLIRAGLHLTRRRDRRRVLVAADRIERNRPDTAAWLRREAAAF